MRLALGAATIAAITGILSACTKSASSRGVFAIDSSSDSSAYQTCHVQGAWRRVSAAIDGEPHKASSTSMKLVTAGHFVWVQSDSNRPKADPRTAADSLRVFTSYGAGGGTYMLRGNRYLEHIDQFMYPSMVGMDLEFTCRTEGRRWYHSGTLPADDSTRPGLKLEEVWERIE